MVEFAPDLTALIDEKTQAAIDRLCALRQEEDALMARLNEIWVLAAPYMMQIKARGLEEARKALALPIPGMNKAYLADWIGVESGEYPDSPPNPPVVVAELLPLEEVYAALSALKAEENQLAQQGDAIYQVVQPDVAILTAHGKEFALFMMQRYSIAERAKWFLHEFRRAEESVNAQ